MDSREKRTESRIGGRKNSASSNPRKMCLKLPKTKNPTKRYLTTIANHTNSAFQNQKSMLTYTPKASRTQSTWANCSTRTNRISPKAKAKAASPAPTRLARVRAWAKKSSRRPTAWVSKTWGRTLRKWSPILSKTSRARALVVTSTYSRKWKSKNVRKCCNHNNRHQLWSSMKLKSLKWTQSNLGTRRKTSFWIPLMMMMRSLNNKTMTLRRKNYRSSNSWSNNFNLKYP